MKKDLSTTKKVALNTFFQLIGKVLSMSVTVLVTLVVARYFGRSAYGEFSLMQAWPALFFIIVDFGFNAIAVREISRNWNNAGRYFGTVVYLRVLLALMLMLIFSISVLFFPYSANLKIGIVVSMFLIITQGLYATGNIIFQSKLRYDLSTLAYLFGYIVIVIFTGLSVFLNLGIIAVSFSYVLGGIATFFCMLYYIKKHYPEIVFSVDKVLAKDLIKLSLPLGLMFLFSQLNFKSDAILLSVMRLPDNLKLSNNDSVALYSLPYKIFEVALVVPTFLMNALYPIFIKSYKESTSKLKDVFKKSFIFLGISGVIVSIFGIILAPLVIQLLGGTAFARSTVVLQILLVGLPLYFLTQPLSWLLVTLGNQKILPKIYAISAVFNISMNAYFIPKFSFYASAVITHLSELLILVLLLFTVIRLWTKKNVENTI